MITINRGKKTLTVSRGAFNNYFRAKGFVEVGSAQTSEIPGVPSYPPEYESQHLEDPTQQESDSGVTYAGGPDEDGEPNLSEIPLGEMSLGQLYEYAEQLGVPTDGMHNRKELRAAIRKYLES